MINRKAGLFAAEKEDAPKKKAEPVNAVFWGLGEDLKHCRLCGELSDGHLCFSSGSLRRFFFLKCFWDHNAPSGRERRKLW